MKRKALYVAYMGIMVAIAMSLHAVEALIPVPFMLPGAKLGLANIVALYVLVLYGLHEGLTVTALRCLLGSLISGTFLSLSFFLSTSGGLMSTLVMGMVLSSGADGFSLVGISMLGATVHNVTQLLVAVFMTSQWGLFVYLPYLLLFALPTGMFVGMVVSRLTKATEHSFRPGVDSLAEKVFQFRRRK